MEKRAALAGGHPGAASSLHPILSCVRNKQTYFLHNPSLFYLPRPEVAMPSLTSPVVRAVLVGVLSLVVFSIAYTLLFLGEPVAHAAGVGAAVPLAYLEYRRAKKALE